MKRYLANAFLKIEWAEKHILNLNIEINKFMDGHSHTAFVEHDPDGPGDLLKVRQEYDTPSGISLAMGDVIHNLHSALDIAINEIEAITCGSMTRYTKFPIRETKQEFEAAINGGLEKKVPFEILTFLRVDVQPYLGGNGATLLHLHNLDIEDKHRLLLTTTHLAFVNGIRIKLDDGAEVYVGDWLIVPNAVAQQCLSGNRNVEVTEQGKPTFYIEIGKGLPLEGQFVVPTCCQLAEFVTGVVWEMERIMSVWVKYRA